MVHLRRFGFGFSGPLWNIPQAPRVPSQIPKETEMPQDSRETPPAAALGDELDRGKGRDKIPYPDPAAAPLGTDDEAAGTPVTPEQMDMARAEEIRTETPDESAA